MSGGASGKIAAFFQLRENGTTVRTEVIAGITTFLTMAYIIFVQPAVLSGQMFGAPTGMDFGAVMTATCLATALASAIMGLYARYPIAQSAGMGENFFFVFTAIPAAAAAGFANAWQVALGTVFWSGVLFLLISLTPLRERLLNGISASMKMAISAGIGIFIAFIGLKNAGIIVADPGTFVHLTPKLFGVDTLVFLIGLIVAVAMQTRKVPGGILIGIAAAAAAAVGFKLAGGAWLAGSLLEKQFAFAKGIVSAPPSMASTFLQMDLMSALKPSMWHLIFVFLFMVLFDTTGTLVGVAQQAGFLKDNKLPRAGKAMVSDAAATVAGAAMGTSTVTSFIESAAGVQAGGRTGLTAVVTALCFLVALFFSPVVAMVGSYPPITAAALVLVGGLMLRNVKEIEWDDPTEVVPSFLMLIGIPLSFSIADGLALGFVSYVLIKICTGRGREVPLVIYLAAASMVAFFIVLRG